MNLNETNCPDCKRCEILRQRFAISSPATLAQAIRVARDNVADRTIIEVPYGSETDDQPPFSDLKTEGPWNDVLGYAFRCTTCGQLFHLRAETYHGSGGEWCPVTHL
ncbi:MAG: hypothetical protein C5B50_09060 [Verrucomicrobia bacterium]|nr:MAG: hypothetical protein C5B50_09060 [Verrucomicrobiota bacterium]